MDNYVIFTDSSCDIEAALLEKWGVKSVSLTFRFDGSEKEYSDRDLAAPDFYRMMREGGVSRTSAANTGDFRDAFEPALEALEAGFAVGDVKAAWDNAVKSAEEGVEYTKTIVATKGRASYLGERSIGHQDPGATSITLMLKACAAAAQ